MINFLKKYKKKTRSYTFLCLVCIFYLFSISYLFWQHDLLASVVCLLLLYLFLHFLSLDYKYFKKIYILWFMLWLLIFDLLLFFLFSWDINIWLIFSLFIFNFSIFVLFYSLDTVEFKSISYFLKWGYIFTLFITISYSVALIWMFSKFPLTCEWLREASNKLIEFVEKPITMPVNTIKKTIAWDQKSIQTWLVDEKVENVVLWFKEVEISADSDSLFYPLVYKINTWKEDVVDQVILDQKSYSQGVCNMLLTEINAKYKLKEVWFSAVVLIYFLLFGFIRLSFFVMSFIWFLMFKLLYLLWVYEIKKVQKEVKEIK